MISRIASESRIHPRSSKGKSELSEFIVGILFLLSDSSFGLLVFGESSSERSGLLLSQVHWSIFAFFEILSCLFSSFLVNDSQNLGDGLSNNSDSS
jgi:hypothetical protein